MMGVDTWDDNAYHARLVAGGMAWLDERVPGWERKIDLSVLNLMNCHNCILGQVFRVEDLQVTGWRLVSNVVLAAGENMVSFAAAYGFAGDTDRWITAIKERFDSGQLSDMEVGP